MSLKNTQLFASRAQVTVKPEIYHALEMQFSVMTTVLSFLADKFDKEIAKAKADGISSLIMREIKDAAYEISGVYLKFRKPDGKTIDDVNVQLYEFLEYRLAFSDAKLRDKLVESGHYIVMKLIKARCVAHGEAL